MPFVKTAMKVPSGAQYMLLSALGFALMSTCVKLSAQQGIPLMEIVAARSLVSLLISYIDVRRRGLSPWGKHKKLLFARGVIGSLALICVYFAVTTLPLAEATLLQYMHPVFTALLALLILKEGIQLSTILCIVLCIAGLVVMVQPDSFDGAQLGSQLSTQARLPPFSVAVALIGAFGSAIAYVLVRKLAPLEDASVIIFYFPLIALPLSAVLLGDAFVIPNGQALVLLLMVGVFTQVGQLGLTHAMRSETASKAAAFSYIQVIFAVILGWTVFGEIPATWTWIGGALIVSGAMLNLVRR